MVETEVTEAQDLLARIAGPARTRNPAAKPRLPTSSLSPTPPATASESPPAAVQRSAEPMPRQLPSRQQRQRSRWPLLLEPLLFALALGATLLALNDYLSRSGAPTTLSPQTPQIGSVAKLSGTPAR